jgi:hypothetical protein
MNATADERIDVSDVRDEDKAYLLAYFQAALEGRSFRACKVTWLDPARGKVSFHVVFDDDSRSEALEVPTDVAFGEDRSDQVIYDDDTGARRTVLGFVPDGVLKRLVDKAFSVSPPSPGEGTA